MHRCEISREGGRRGAMGENVRCAKRDCVVAMTRRMTAEMNSYLRGASGRRRTRGCRGSRCATERRIRYRGRGRGEGAQLINYEAATSFDVNDGTVDRNPRGQSGPAGPSMSPDERPRMTVSPPPAPHTFAHPWLSCDAISAWSPFPCSTNCLHSRPGPRFPPVIFRGAPTPLLSSELLDTMMSKDPCFQPLI